MGKQAGSLTLVIVLMLQSRAQYESLAQFDSADTSDWDVEEATHQSLKIFFFLVSFMLNSNPAHRK